MWQRDEMRQEEEASNTQVTSNISMPFVSNGDEVGMVHLEISSYNETKAQSRARTWAFLFFVLQSDLASAMPF